MRSRTDPLLAPGATKESAIQLIRSGIEMRNGAPSAARIAKECLARRFLLSPEEQLLVGCAILIGTANKADADIGDATWKLASRSLLKRGKADVVLHFALKVFTIELARQKYPKAYAGLERAKPAAERLPAHHAGILQYERSVEEYVYLTGDAEGGERLTLE